MEDQRKTESKYSTTVKVQSELFDGNANPSSPHVTNGSPV